MKHRSSNPAVTGWGVSNRHGRLRPGALCLAILLGIILAAVRGWAIDQVTRVGSDRLAISVRVYTYARVSPSDLALAEHVASKIFQEAGVELTWFQCPVAREEAQQIPTCRSGNEPTEVFLRIVPDFVDVPRLSSTSMGFALPTPPPNRGFLASIAYARAKKPLVETPGLTTGLLLGHGIAHEIGHLLLGSNSHSPTGLMSARWGEQELKLAARLQLIFSEEQAIRIRDDVGARMKDAGLPELAAAAAK